MGNSASFLTDWKFWVAVLLGGACSGGASTIATGAAITSQNSMIYISLGALVAGLAYFMAARQAGEKSTTEETKQEPDADAE